MSGAYDRDLRLLAWRVAQSLGYDFLHEGIYGFQFGPAFETVAESCMMRMLGSDVAGKYHRRQRSRHVADQMY